jgi:pterin-4a-carbinolamine dehydratase
VLAERANHHPTFSVNPARKCETEGGCDVDVELSSYSKKAVTYADVALARRLNALAVLA